MTGEALTSSGGLTGKALTAAKKALQKSIEKRCIE